MAPSRIGVVTIADDLHALLVQRALRDMGHRCEIIEVDRLSGSPAMTWTNQSAPSHVCRLPTRGGGPVDVRELDAVWWRRTQSRQRLPWPLDDPAQVDLVDRDCAAAVLGSMLTRFHGAWINDPVRAFHAENKLVQLDAARAAGLRVPRTLVSQDPEEIREFCAATGPTVVKAVMGTPKVGLLTRMVTDRHLASDDALRVAPAIYQELVPGARHVRAQCFGERVTAVLVTSEHLDWRARLDSPMEPWTVPGAVREKLSAVLRSLGLRMGIVDLKLTDEGECVWLEVNQQGQFLFLEGLTGVPLTLAFSRFLVDEARRASRAGAGAPPAVELAGHPA